MSIMIRSAWLRLAARALGGVLFAVLLYVATGMLLGLVIDALGHRSPLGELLSGAYVYLSPMMFGIPSILILFLFGLALVSKVVKAPRVEDQDRSASAGQAH